MKTLKDHLKPAAIGILILIALGVLVKVYNSRVDPARSFSKSTFVFLAMIFIMAIAHLAYCFSGDFKRKRYKKYGTKFEGYIDSARKSKGGRGYDRYYLNISFNDGGRKTRRTEAYIEDPCKVLRSRECSVYKYRGKYIEADFQPAEKGSKGCLDIPVSDHK
ncbi:MAG: hypothetical protein K5857_02815 [Lachnospiraceae bacterium]|nr:hypothetical protein [Lachnospiraceae bacterium]